MLRWTEANVCWINRSTVVACEHASSTFLSTHLQLTGGDAESKEPGRYSPGNTGLMAHEESGAEATPPGSALQETLAPNISVPTMPY
jgi:hypothetical protein